MGLCVENNSKDIGIIVKDDLNHPKFHWPVTRLQCPVEFVSEPEHMVLRDVNSGTYVPFQLKDIQHKGEKIAAQLIFLCDLKSGEEKRLCFEEAKGRRAETDNGVQVYNDNEHIILDNGLIKIAIPMKGKVYDYPRNAERVPTPIMNLGQKNVWYAKGEFMNCPDVYRFDVEEISRGPILAEYKLTYYFEKDWKYEVVLRLISCMEFVEIEESISGFTTSQSAAWGLVYDSLQLEYRYAPNRPDRPKNIMKRGYDGYEWEPIDKNLGPNGSLPFKIAPYHNWMTWWRLPTAAFWNEAEDITTGIFIKDMEKWNDGKYTLWGSKDDLCIHFYYQQCLQWRIPLVSGTRSIAFAVYPHHKDVERVDEISRPMIYMDELRRWYGWLPLDKVSQWILDFDESDEYPKFLDIHAQGLGTEIEELKNFIFEESTILNTIPIATERSGGGPNPVSSREFYSRWMPGFERLASQMNESEKRKFRAIYVFMAYLYMDEALMPMKNMLAGHPNFLADIKGIPGIVAYLFPHHPHARMMADHFEKSVQLNLNYHVRPDVPAWEAQGGRWTENLACYTWAHLIPVIKTSFLLHYYFDGRNAIAHSNIKKLARWILNSLTVPLDKLQGKRAIPPQGAHSRTQDIPYLLRVLGQELMYYDPLCGEHLLYVTSCDDAGFEESETSPWRKMLDGVWKNNNGTELRLVSKKFTGYGFVFREAVGTPDEVYIHLQQIDEGPNYRWGRAGKGGNGIIYYYAAGKCYSHIGVEDVGDALRGDVERCTNFGVKKEGGYRCVGEYRCVGRNDLTEPLYNFGFSQYAKVNAGQDAYPEYRSRSVLLSGTDYMIVYDEVQDHHVEGRFSWFVGKEGEFPEIQQLKPGVGYNDALPYKNNDKFLQDEEETTTKGRYYDGFGSFLSLVSHKKNIKSVSTEYGCKVMLDGRTDYVFRNPEYIPYQDEEICCHAGAGIIRKYDDSSFEAAIFEGNMVAISGIKVTISDEKAGFSVQSIRNGLKGSVQTRKRLVLHLENEGGTQKNNFYLGGVRVESEINKNGIDIVIPEGLHHWQWCNGASMPAKTNIIRTENRNGGFTVYWEPTPEADSYSLEISRDGGLTWTRAVNGMKGTCYTLTGLENGIKIHIRIIVANREKEESISDQYPVYINSEAPHQPEGLRLRIMKEKVSLNWGEVLGVSEYRLYRKKRGDTKFEVIYKGLEREYIDDISNDAIYEYCVTSVNGNGESKKGIVVDSDKDSFINWEPIPGEGFRRDTESQENGYGEYNNFIEEKMPILQYPI